MESDRIGYLNVKTLKSCCKDVLCKSGQSVDMEFHTHTGLHSYFKKSNKSFCNYKTDLFSYNFLSLSSRVVAIPIEPDNHSKEIWLRRLDI